MTEAFHSAQTSRDFTVSSHDILKDGVFAAMYRVPLHRSGVNNGLDSVRVWHTDLMSSAMMTSSRSTSCLRASLNVSSYCGIKFGCT